MHHNIFLITMSRYSLRTSISFNMMAQILHEVLVVKKSSLTNLTCNDEGKKWNNIRCTNIVFRIIKNYVKKEKK